MGCDEIVIDMHAGFSGKTMFWRMGCDIYIYIYIYMCVCEWIRMYLMNRFATLRDKLKNYKGEVMPNPWKGWTGRLKSLGIG